MVTRNDWFVITEHGDCKFRLTLEFMSSKFSAAVIFLHGSGDSGPGVKDWINHANPCFLESLESANIKVVFPTAPTRPYTMMNGEQSNVWHDRLTFGNDAAEDIDGLKATAVSINEIVQELVHGGIELQRIIIGGFSMGGGTSLILGLSLIPNIGGVFSMSSWVSTKSHLWDVLEQKKVQELRQPPVFLSHGGSDGLINIEWGESTKDVLLSKGLDVEWLREPGLDHEPGPLGLQALSLWLREKVLD